MNFLPGWDPGFLMAGGNDASVSFVDWAMSSSNATSYNFGTKSIGPAHASRVLIAWISWDPQTTANFSHFSIDGTATNFRVGNTGASAGSTVQIRTLPWPTGTTATVTMAGTAQLLNCYWMMWAAYYLNNEAPTASHTALGVGANPASDNINVSAGGIVIAGSGALASASSGFDWTGLTEDHDGVGGISSTARMSGASGAFHAAQSPLTVSSNAHNANHIQTMAAFR